MTWILLLCSGLWLALAVLSLGLAQAAKRGDEVQRAAWDEEVDRHARTLDFP